MKLKIRKTIEVNNVFFSADTHFGHANILKYCNRPFDNVEEMDKTILTNFNNQIQEDDVLFLLGDFCWRNYKEYRARINCKNIFFIYGNHDKRMRRERAFNELWIEAYDLLGITVENQDIVLCHYAMRRWDKSHRSAWQLYGHSHGDLPDDPKLLSFDCGVDCFNFCPVSFSEVSEIMKKKKENGAIDTLHH